MKGKSDNWSTMQPVRVEERLQSRRPPLRVDARCPRFRLKSQGKMRHPR